MIDVYVSIPSGVSIKEMMMSSLGLAKGRAFYVPG
jgi:hypothetical protein